MNSNNPAYVYDAVRLPRARVRKGGGTLAGVPPVELIGRLLEALDERCGASDVVDDVVLGISTVTGEQSGNIARAAVQWAGWPDHVSGGVVSRLCCSGLDAVETGAMRVATGNARVVAGVSSRCRAYRCSPIRHRSPSIRNSASAPVSSPSACRPISRRRATASPGNNSTSTPCPRTTAPRRHRPARPWSRRKPVMWNSIRTKAFEPT